MPHRRPNPEHQEAVSRRLALLSAELAGSRPEPPDDGHTRIRPAPIDPGVTPTLRPWPVGPPESLPEDPHEDPHEDPPEGRLESHTGAPPVPVPGRHASRRRPAGPAALLPEPLRGRVDLGPAQLTVVALLVAAGLAITCWWVVRADARPVEVPSVGPAPGAVTAGSPASGADSPVASPGSSSGASPVAGPGSAAAAGTVTVDVEGKVRRPGIVVLDAGARVVDAVRRAGGARPGADLTGLNLARVLVDGEQLLVGVVGPAPVVGGSPAAPATAGTPGTVLVDLNTASQSQLEALPEVGPVTAQSIITWRDEHGGFTSVDELLEVDGIGDATLEQIAPYVTV